MTLLPSHPKLTQQALQSGRCFKNLGIHKLLLDSVVNKQTDKNKQLTKARVIMSALGSGSPDGSTRPLLQDSTGDFIVLQNLIQARRKIYLRMISSCLSGRNE